MNFEPLNRTGRYERMLIIGLLLAMLGLPSFPAGAAAADAPAKKIPFPRPQSHTGNWIEYHGRSADVSMIGTGRTCLVCHEKTDCISCHNTMAPRDHTNTWRTLSHGFMAEGNRERCLTCHKQALHSSAPHNVSPALNCGLCHQE